MPANVENFVQVSEFSHKILDPYLPPHTAFSVANPISISRSTPVDVAKNQAFVMVGRLSPEKGPLIFARAARQSRVSAVFVGEGDLRNEVSKANPDARMTGWVDSKQVREELASARALVMPSVWYETQGLVVLEASALGVPAIVAAGTAAADLVKNGVTGLHFRKGNVEDLVQKIEMLKDPTRAMELGHAAYERFWENPPTVERHVRELEECYEAVLRKA
jgi:glycosyltransferase involved in cell wall biosynthesis